MKLIQNLTYHVQYMYWVKDQETRWLRMNGYFKVTKNVGSDYCCMKSGFMTLENLVFEFLKIWYRNRY